MMKIITITNKLIRFKNNTNCDVYLASLLNDYIVEKDDSLSDYIGFSDEDNQDGINDFLYTGDKKTIKKIENHVNCFLKQFELIFELLEKKCEEALISDNVEFYEEFMKLNKIIIQKNTLEKNLEIKDISKTKLKV